MRRIGPSTSCSLVCLLTIVSHAEAQLATRGAATAQPSAQQADRDAPLPPGVERTDWLTLGQGAIFVSQTGLAVGSSQRVLDLIDGNRRKVTLTTDAGDPISLVYALPADTTFDRFAIPNVVETPGNATFFRTIVISGSRQGPDLGYEVLATAELETHGPDQEVTELVPDLVAPMRWVKVDLMGGINIVTGDEGRTNLQFTEVIGTGTQEPMPLSTGFAGGWDLRLTERPDRRGTPLALRQDGSTISGCLGDAMLSGTVNGSIARMTGARPSGRLVFLILVADEGGVLNGVTSPNGRAFGARTAVTDPAVETSCVEDAPVVAACGSVVYVNFDVDSAGIRPESEQVLSDLYDRLVADPVANVSIVGHTSTEGTEDYNLALSERRARAVVAALVTRGYEAAAISGIGRGEAEPLIARDDNESARSLNRRVEIDCGPG